MDDDSLDLVEQASTGSLVAVEQLIERLLPDLRSYVRLKCGPVIRAQESSSDLAQSVCREILGELNRAERKSAPAFKAWLFKVAEHKIIDRARFYTRRKRDVRREREHVDGLETDLDHRYGGVLGPRTLAMSAEAIELIEAAFDEIPERYREAILLVRVAGLSYEELGERMGCTAHSARTLMSRALARLAAVIGTDTTQK